MLLLDAAIEKISNVCILLRLSHTIIMHANFFPNFSQNVFMIAGRKSNRQRKRSVVDREANKVDLRAAGHFKLFEARNRECPCKLSRSIRPEVEKDNGIAILNCRHWLAISVNDYGWLDKLVSNTSLVGTQDGRHRLGSSFTLAFHQKLVGTLGSFPTLVAIHCVVAPD